MKVFVLAINRLADAIFALAKAVHDERNLRREYNESDIPF